MDGVAISRSDCVKYLRVHLDHDLSWKSHTRITARKANGRMRYIQSLFPSNAQRARIMLFQSLVQPLLDYCSTSCIPRLKSHVDEMESPVKRFLRTIHLGVLPEATSDIHYCQRFQQIGWEPLVLRRIKLCLVLTFKLMFGILPYGDQMFEPFESELSVSTIAGNTRAQRQLMEHPRPLQIRKLEICGRIVGPVDRSMAHIVEKIWNKLPFPAESYDTVFKFAASLDSLNWTQFPQVVSLSSGMSFFLTQL